MQSELRKYLDSGFALDEQELRRLVNLCTEQARNLDSSVEPEITFQVKFRNGVSYKPPSVDEIVGLENHGSESITGLSIETNISEIGSIEINFAERGGDFYIYGFRESGMSYSVESSTSKDWVFVTTSKIEERLRKIRRRVFLTKFWEWEGAATAVVFVAATVLALSLIALSDTAYSIEQLRQKYISGEIADPVLALIELELLKKPRFFGYSSKEVFAILLIALLPIGFLIAATSSWLSRAVFPAYNFLWGDYRVRYDRNQKIARYIFFGLIATFVIGVAASLLAIKLAA